MAAHVPGPLVSAGWLNEHLRDPNLRVVDFRWYLDGRSGRDAYRSGHLPGAVFIDLDAITAAEGPGRHPIPRPEVFEAAMRAAGISHSTFVVAYDDAAGSIAARLWWLLRHFGHRSAAVLDGGIQDWQARGGVLETGETAFAPGDFTVGRDQSQGEVVDLEGVRSRPEGTVLLDARAPERYRGETEPVDPRAGHIPGALSAPWTGNVGPDWRFLSPEELRARFQGLGVERGREVIAYCGSGVNACHLLLALELAGIGGGRLYEGSWSDWSRHPELPAATGPEPRAGTPT